MAANPYTTWVKNVRRAAQEAWTVARSNTPQIGLDYVTWALDQIMNLDDPDNPMTLNMHVASPFKIVVAAGVTWTLGWWQSADGRWWLLVNTADVASFTRADAEFYIPTGSISNVPTA